MRSRITTTFAEEFSCLGRNIEESKMRHLSQIVRRMTKLLPEVLEKIRGEKEGKAPPRIAETKLTKDLQKWS